MKRSEFEQKFIRYFQQSCKLYLPSDIFTLCETPNQLIEYVGWSDEIMKLPKEDRNEDARRLNPNIKKKGTPIHWHLHNYIMSRIPTDLYLIRNPSLGIETDPATGLKTVISKKSQRLLNANKFNNRDIEKEDISLSDEAAPEQQLQ